MSLLCTVVVYAFIPILKSLLIRYILWEPSGKLCITCNQAVCGVVIHTINENSQEDLELTVMMCISLKMMLMIRASL